MSNFTSILKDYTLTKPIGLYSGAEFILSEERFTVFNPYNALPVAELSYASAEDIDRSIAIGVQAEPACKKLAGYQRAKILEQIATGIDRRKSALALGITLESGKPISAATVEVERAIFTFRVAAEECRRLDGSRISLDWLAGNEQRDAIIIPEPRGLTVGITPFNFPLNLVAHKVAPALAVGNPIIIRPASQTALTALHLAEIIAESELPPGGFQVLPCDTSTAGLYVTDPRVKFLSFTGSPSVGWNLKSKVGRKPITLELGGNAGNIVHHDANLDWAGERIVWGGYFNAGQSCISAQRIYLHAECYAQCKEDLIARTASIKFGDPQKHDTFVGPVINASAADRIEKAINDAMNAGATLLYGGQREGNLISPTLLESDDENLDIACTEIFGPVMVISKYEDTDLVLDRVNDSDYGLQAGLFTNDFQFIRKAMRRLEVGGLNINDVSAYRIDHMPYGGVKGSGFGREGLKYAMLEMAETKLVTFHSP